VSCPRFLYVISSPFGYQKIGWTIDLKTRLTMLSQAHPLPVTLYKAWELIDATKVETEVHKCIDYLRTNGEWFCINAESAVELVEAVHGISFEIGLE